MRLARISTVPLTLVALQAAAALATDYGTPTRPRECPGDLTQPKSGPPTIERAKAIFYCDAENEAEFSPGRSILTLADNLDLRIAPRPRRATVTDTFEYRDGLKGALILDQTRPVYDLKVSYVETVCHSRSGVEQITPQNECTARQFQMSPGLCFQDTFGDWHCRIHRDSWRGARPVTPPKR